MEYSIVQPDLIDFNRKLKLPCLVAMDHRGALDGTYSTCHLQRQSVIFNSHLITSRSSAAENCLRSSPGVSTRQSSTLFRISSEWSYSFLHILSTQPANPATMVIGIAVLAALLPTMIGLNEASQHTRDHEEDRRASARKQRCHLIASCSLTQGTPSQRGEIQNAKVYVDQDGRVSLPVLSFPTTGCLLQSAVYRSNRQPPFKRRSKAKHNNLFLSEHTALHHERTAECDVSIQWGVLYPSRFPDR